MAISNGILIVFGNTNKSLVNVSGNVGATIPITYPMTYTGYAIPVLSVCTGGNNWSYVALRSSSINLTGCNLEVWNNNSFTAQTIGVTYTVVGY